jgi:GNAT superfamily N-acetyltransferase
MGESKIRIRRAIRSDASAIHALHTMSVTTLCLTHYPAELIQRWIKGRTPEGYFEGIDPGAMFVCEKDEEMAGFGHAVPGEIVAVFVDPRYVGQGIGSRLLAHGLAMARSGFAGPIKVISTLNAESFYARHGFRPTNRYSVIRNDTEVPMVEMELAE